MGKKKKKETRANTHTHSLTHRHMQKRKIPGTHLHPWGRLFLPAAVRCPEFVPGNILAYSWSLFSAEQPECIAFSLKPAQLPAPCGGRAGPFTQAPPSGNALLFEHHDGHLRAKDRAWGGRDGVWGFPGRQTGAPKVRCVP